MFSTDGPPQDEGVAFHGAAAALDLTVTSKINQAELVEGISI